MSDNRFVFATTLEGYINALIPSGKFNNCSIGFRIPDELIPEFDQQYENAIEWGKNKLSGKRSTAELPKWDESGYVKLSYGGDSNNPMFPWVDTDGQPIPMNTQIWKGTKVRLIVDVKPYVFTTKIGLSFKVKGAQIISLSSGNGYDSGDISDDDVVAIFGSVDGFKVGSPNFQPAPTEDGKDGGEYSTDLPF